ncbi:MAG: hypothetical protein AAGC57_12360 [Pseudomonadota bacterium]
MATTAVAARRAGMAFVTPVIVLVVVTLLFPIGGAAVPSFSCQSLGNPGFDRVA